VADDRERDTERTTIVTTDGDGRGSAGLILLVALIVILLAVLFFGGVFDRDDASDLNLAVTTPDANLAMPPAPPQVIVVPEGQAQPPDVNVNITTPPPENPPPEANDTNSL
jgi:hypothetical protein